MKKVVVLLLISILFNPELLAGGTEEGSPPAYEEFPEALGFQYGEISGTGLSYQAWRGAVGYQYAAGVIYMPLDGDSWLDTTLDYAIGAEGQFRVYGEDFADWLSGQLYTFVGLGHRGYIPIETVSDGRYIEDTDEYIEPVFATGNYTPVIGLGAGIGIEIILFRHFSVPIELGYGVKWEPTAGALDKQFHVDLYPQIGFRYRY